MASLFRAWSQVDHFMGQDQVTFNWFVVGRQEPVVPYQELIENYDEDDDEAGYDRLLTDEFFTQEEVEELRNYLLQFHNLQIQVEEVLLPVRSGGLSYGLLLISGAKGFYSLADEAEYPLDLAVLGHFNIKEEKSSSSLSTEDLQIGTRFLEKALNYLEISVFEQNDIMAVLKKIHDETGLRVQKDTRQADRLNTTRIEN